MDLRCLQMPIIISFGSERFNNMTADSYDCKLMLVFT